MIITCYNIHSGMDASNKLTIGRMIKYLNSLKCDVICLQEVIYSQFLLMKTLLNMNGVFAANVVKPHLKYGICIFSREKIELSEHVLLPSKKEQRGFVCITINTKENTKLNIINTHLGLDKIERVEQIDVILKYMKQLSGKNILCGDFNEKNITINELIDSAVYLKKDDCPTFKTSRIDYIFCSKNCIPQEFFVNVINLSDHYPLISNINV